MASGGINTGLPITGTAPTPVAAPLGNVALSPVADGWNDDWAKRFHDVGASKALISQLNFTGAMGASNAELEQVLADVTAEVNGKLAALQSAFPEQYAKLEQQSAAADGGAALSMSIQAAFPVESQVNMAKGMAPGDGRAALVDLADIAATTTLTQPEFAAKLDEIEAQTDAASSFEGIGMIKTMVAGSAIPAYGLYRAASGLAFDGHDVLTQERLTNDPMSVAMTGAWAAGSTITLANQIRNGRQIHAGVQLLKQDPKLAASMGVAAPTSALDTFKAYAMPWSKQAQALSGAGRMRELTEAAATLKEGSLERKLADGLLDQWRSGKIAVHGEGIVKPSLMGMFPRWRGMAPGFGNRGKELVTTSVVDNRATLSLDGRFSVKEWGRSSQASRASIGALLAGEGAQFASGDLKAEMQAALGASADGATGARALSSQREEVVARAVRQLTDDGALVRGGAADSVLGVLRPGPIEDAAKAAKNVLNGTPLKTSWFSGLSKMGKAGVIGGGLAAGLTAMTAASYYLMIKPQQEQALEVQRRLDAEAAAAGTPAPATTP